MSVNYILNKFIIYAQSSELSYDYFNSLELNDIDIINEFAAFSYGKNDKPEELVEEFVLFINMC